MNHIFALLSAIVFATCAAPHFVDAHENLSPHQRTILDSKSPPPEEYRFGFDLPAGPQFSEAEKEAQRVRGGEVMVRDDCGDGPRGMRALRLRPVPDSGPHQQGG